MANNFIFDDDDQQANTGAPAAEESGSEGGEGSNRTFMIAAVILGGIVLLSLICMAVYAILILPNQRKAALAADSTNSAAYTQTAIAGQATQEAAQFTPTLPPTDTPTPAPTDTPVLLFATDTPTSEPSVDPATATVFALQTQLANAQLTATYLPTTTGTVTALAKTGFADEVGLPGLFVVTLVLVVVILLARRLRQTPMSH